MKLTKLFRRLVKSRANKHARQKCRYLFKGWRYIRGRPDLNMIVDNERKPPVKEVDDLNVIVCELKKLDGVFSTNVGSLRAQIEVASLEYTEAQKQFDRLEKEYIAAKTDLFVKKERKDHLTSELCSFIKQNELAKAKMLSTFVGKMELVPCPTELTAREPNSDQTAETEETFECD